MIVCAIAILLYAYKLYTEYIKDKKQKEAIKSILIDDSKTATPNPMDKWYKSNK